nr:MULTISPECIES: ESPR-type extended signal peptide-containing protein [unclassified Paraburkholderia]
MNKTYRSIWSDTDQTWVAVAETTRSHRKSSRRSAVLTTGALGIVASLVSTGAFAAGTVGQGGLEICSGVKGYSWGATGSSATLDCSAGSSGVSDGLAFSLNNAGDTNGGYGFDASTARVAGYQNGTLDIKGTNVLVHGPTTFDSIVSMSNQKITNLRPGEISATSTDAINGSQVYAAISKLGDAVFYDTASHNAVTLGDAAAMEPVALHNVANGTLSADSLDAVNGAQLYDAMLQAGGAAHYVGINSAAGSGNYNGEGANGVDTIAIGANASAGAYNSVAMGTGSTASGNYAISFGNQATAAEASIAVGAHSAATEWNDIAIGFGTSAYGGTSIAVGLNSTAAGYHSMAMGGAALTQGSFATALGDSASAISSQGTALGAGAVSTNPGDVALGAGSITDVVAGTSGTTIRGSEYASRGRIRPVRSASAAWAANAPSRISLRAGLAKARPMRSTARSFTRRIRLSKNSAIRILTAREPAYPPHRQPGSIRWHWDWGRSPMDFGQCRSVTRRRA